MTSKDKEHHTPLLHNHIILINNAASDLSRSIATQLAKQGAQLVLLDRNNKALHNIGLRLQSRFKNSVHHFLFDPTRTNPAVYNKLAKKIVTTVPRLDASIFNSDWPGYDVNYISYPPTLWQQVLQVNLSASFMLSQSLIPMLLKAKKPRLIFNSYNSYNHNGKSAYRVAQSGLESLMQACAYEFKDSHLAVFGVQPISILDSARPPNSPNSPNPSNLPNSLLNKEQIQQIARIYPQLLIQPKNQCHGQMVNLHQWMYRHTSSAY